MRLAPAGRSGRSWPTGLASLLLHAAGIGAALLAVAAQPDTLQQGGEAIAIEMVITGNTVANNATEGAKPEEPIRDVADAEAEAEAVLKQLQPAETQALAEELTQPPEIQLDLPSPTVTELAQELTEPPPINIDIPLPALTVLASELTAPPPVKLDVPPPEQVATLAPELAPPPKPAPTPTPAKPEPPRQAEKTPPKPEKPKARQARKERDKPKEVARRSEPAPAKAEGRQGQGEAAVNNAASFAAGTGGSAAVAGAAEVSNYRRQALAHLARYKRFPEAARQAGLQGHPVIAFVISRSGSVISARLSSPSGVALLDDATLAMVRSADPFPPLPAGGPATMSFNARIQYDLR